RRARGAARSRCHTGRIPPAATQPLDRPEHRLGARSGGCGERIAAARCCSGGVAVVSNDRKLLELAGKMADAARAVVGGRAIPLENVPAANVYTLGEACMRLQHAVDACDAAIIDCARSSLPKAAP